MVGLKGIDISHWQGNPDFKRIKAAGVQYVMLKATDGATGDSDICFAKNAAAAITAGLPIGAYHWLHSGDAGAQAKQFLAAIKSCRLTWPAAVDVEDNSLAGMSCNDLTNMLLTFCGTVRAAGYVAAVYASKSWLTDKINTDRLRAAGVHLWMAWYSSATPDNTDRSSLCEMWQYASDGHVDSISGAVDLNTCYVDYAAKSDTTQDMTIAAGGSYLVKLTARIAPKIGIGNGNVLAYQFYKQVSNDYLYRIMAIGKAGQAAGVYANGRKLFTVTVK